MQEHKNSEEVTIQFGKGQSNKVTLNNTFRWFQGLLDNHLFPNCIPDISSREQAKESLARKAGRPEANKVVNAMVNGLANLCKDEGVITASVPKLLLCFIYDILLVMELVRPDDNVVTLDWIKAQISNLKKAGKDARIFTPETRTCSPTETPIIPEYEKRLDWLFNIQAK
jgi:hypothetical protein